MSHARMKTFFFHFSNYLPWSIWFIAAVAGKPGFRRTYTFLVSVYDSPLRIFSVHCQETVLDAI